VSTIAFLRSDTAARSSGGADKIVLAADRSASRTDCFTVAALGRREESFRDGVEYVCP
jgi:hypothetical protein